MPQDAGGWQPSRGVRCVHVVVVLASPGIVCVRAYLKADVQAWAGVGVSVHRVAPGIGTKCGPQHVWRS